MNRFTIEGKLKSVVFDNINQPTAIFLEQSKLDSSVFKINIRHDDLASKNIVKEIQLLSEVSVVGELEPYYCGGELCATMYMKYIQ